MRWFAVAWNVSFGRSQRREIRRRDETDLVARGLYVCGTMQGHQEGQPQALPRQTTKRRSRLQLRRDVQKSGWFC